MIQFVEHINEINSKVNKLGFYIKNSIKVVKIVSDIMDQFSKLVKYGNIGYYNLCKVIQIVLICADGNIYNYFTFIDFDSSKYIKAEEPKYITPKEITINSNVHIAICTYTISIEEIVEIYKNLINNKQWEYKEFNSKIGKTYLTDSKLLPITDWIGSFDGLIPVRAGLCKDNPFSNFYIFEFFNDKSDIRRLLSNDDIKKINGLLPKYKLFYDLDYLNDRIGNIFFRFKCEIVDTKPILMNPNCGIKIEFKWNQLENKKRKILFQVIKEFDNTIISVDNFAELKSNLIEIEPNSYLNKIVIIDLMTNLILYMNIFDFRERYDYRGSAYVPGYVFSPAGKRKIVIDGKESIIQLREQIPTGSVILWDDIETAKARKYKNDVKLLKDQLYLLTYKKDEHEKALQDIRNIINHKSVFWDLKEICLFDPYLTAEDIVKTAFFCEKPNIKIRAITSFQRINKNREVKELLNYTDFKDFEKKQVDIINSSCNDTKINLEFRAVVDDYGYGFHDRFLILRHFNNYDRVWSLGTSINSIGKKHHLIQIVENPQVIVDTFDELWEQINNDTCTIYKTKTD